MRRHLLHSLPALLHSLPALLLSVCAVAHAANRSCGAAWDYASEEFGRINAEVSRGVGAGYYGLSKPESAAFNQQLQKLLDVVLAQPHLRPPRGFNVAGWIRLEKSATCGERDDRTPCLGVPVAAAGPLQFHYFYDIAGKPQTVTEGWVEATWSINSIESAHSGGGGAEIGDLGFYLQLTGQGEINGAAVFKNPATQVAMIVIARSGRPPWTRPVSQQEYLEAAISRLEAELSQQAQRQATVPQSDAPAADIEQRKAERAKGQPAPAKPLTLADRLKRHRERLAAMSPDERRAQAVFMSAPDPLDPPLAAPAKRTQGYPLMRPNPDYFDPKLARTALQLVTFRFGMGLLGPITPDACGGVNPGHVALRQTIHETPWQHIRSLLAP